jgi:hypothetical protein
MESTMARHLEELIREAAELPESDRATLAGAMITSLDPRSTPEEQGAWSREIERQVQKIDDGTVELLDWEDIRRELFTAVRAQAPPVIRPPFRRRLGRRTLACSAGMGSWPRS